MSAVLSRSCAAATLAVFALWLAGTARAQGSDWPAPLPAQASAQQATTRQAGITKADAAEAQPTNIFVSLRVESPGAYERGTAARSGRRAPCGRVRVAGQLCARRSRSPDADRDHDRRGLPRRRG